MQCFESHLPGARHRDAGALEKVSPSPGQEQATETRAPARIIVKSSAPGLTVTGSASKPAALPQEVLIVASRLKEYILAKSDYNTSGAVMDVLSEHVRRLCDEAIDHARAEGRKTVLDRDFEFLKRIRFG